MNLRHSKAHKQSASPDVSKEKKQKIFGTTTLSRKVFLIQNSALTDLLKIVHFQSLYHLCVAVSCLLFISTIAYYLAEPEIFYQEINALSWGASKLYVFVIYWLLLQLWAYCAYEILKFWVSSRITIHEKISDGIFLLLYLTSIIFVYISTAYAMLKIQISPIAGFAITTEQVRITMKIHSFVRENVPRLKQFKLEERNQWQNLYPTRKHYFYYLFAPTLIYRDSYPRTGKICWKSSFSYLFQFLGTLCIGYCVYIRIGYGLFKNAGLYPFTKKETYMIFTLYSLARGISFTLVLFYGFLHCWFNFAAELMKFADREFYKDWWNSKSPLEYNRKWFVILHDWLHAYIYTDSQRMGLNRFFAQILVFGLSSILHEYIVIVAFGIFQPLMFIMSMLGVCLMSTFKQPGGKLGNFSFLFTNIFGCGVVMSLYHIEWFAKQNCLPKNETLIDFLTPRTWDPSCHVFS